MIYRLRVSGYTRRPTETNQLAQVELTVMDNSKVTLGTKIERKNDSRHYQPITIPQVYTSDDPACK